MYLKHKNAQVILYGAGNTGAYIYGFLKAQGLKSMVYAFCDKRTDILSLEDRPIITYQAAQETELPFVITVAQNTNFYQEIETLLKEDNAKYYTDIIDYEVKELGYGLVKVNRDYCGYFHVDNMESYFANAEKRTNAFWSKESVFLKLFERMDLRNVIELACGRGRHVPHYLLKAGKITLVDILEKNIDFVKSRFANENKVHYYKNNGHDLSQLANNEYTALFTYDAMVHFELLDIYEYLRETYRILVPSGMALFHHSNYSSDYRNSFLRCSNSNGRNFMSKDIFAHLADRSGLEVIEQQLIDWAGVPNLDCITLVQKPK